VAGQEGSVTLGEAPLHVDPVRVTLVRLADGSSIEGSEAAQPRNEAWRRASPAELAQLQLEIGHDSPSVTAGIGGQ
jgi:hypothetical protein